jgi:hypothetical protein
VTKGCLARAIGAPARIGIDRRIAGDVDDNCAAPVSRRCGKGAKQRFGQSERPEQVYRQSPLELLALRIGEKFERNGAEARGIVDQDIEPTEISSDLQCDRIDIVLSPDITDNSVRAGIMGSPLYGRCATGNEGDFRTLCCEQSHERQTQTGCPAGDGDTKDFEIVLEIHSSFHRQLLCSKKRQIYKFK